MKNRIISLLLSVCMLFTLCSCSGPDKTPNDGTAADPNTAASGIVSLAYSETDSFNPYTAANATNREIATLIFDSLFFTDDTFTLRNNLAVSYETVGNTCTVTIKNAVFSDGSKLTANDVVYSFNAAKQSGGRYAAQLATIQSAAANGTDKIIFTCSKADPYAANLLTFPIIKTDSDKLKNEDNVSLPPIGCGRYLLNDTLDGLTANDNWHGGTLSIKNIKLINAPDDESLSHAVEIGAIDIYYTDLSDCKILRMSGSRLNINLNNLVYIGVNHKNSFLKSTYMRQAISAALNRQKICETAFYTNAIPATGIFHPSWGPTKSIQSIQILDNSEIAIENLEKIGYNRQDNGKYFENANGDAVALRLLVNSENQFRSEAADMIAAQLGSVGIKVDVQKVSYTEYLSRLNAGSFDLYIGEVSILENMDVTALLCPGGSAAYGIIEPAPTDTDEGNTYSLSGVINGFYAGRNTISDIAATAISEMPIIPVCYRTGVLLCGDDIGNCDAAYQQNIFYSINKITAK